MSTHFVEALVKNAYFNRSFNPPLSRDQLLDIQLLPLYAAVASLILFLLQPRSPNPQYFQKQSPTRKAFILSRLLGCLSLLLSIPTSQRTHYSIPISSLYATILSSLQLTQSHNRKATTHSIPILLSIFAVYFQRDIYPLLTTTQTPVDADDPFLHLKLGIITYTAIFVPLFIPRQYVPVDPENPMDVPNPEQEASIISLLFYFFLDPIIIKASRLDTSVDDLPPLADYDRAQFLEKRGVPHLTKFSGKSSGRMFFKLIRVFRKEYTIQLLAIIFEVLTSFGGPIAINRILSYLETSESTLKPTFWILTLFLSPLLYGAAQQVFTFSVNRVSVNAQAVLVMLLFDHALCISACEEGKSVDGKGLGGVNGELEGEGGSLIGKLNNLVTTDVNNIVGAAHFLLPLFAAPLQMCMGIVFLYYILGYSAFIGLLVLVLSAPLPQTILNKVAEVQEEKMRWTDERVKSITEVVSLLRMIKMFAWESKVDQTISAVRGREVSLLWQGRVWDVVNVTVNSIISALIMLLTFAFYTLVMKEELSASKVFSSTPIFLLIRIQFYRITKLTQVVRARVSLDRVEGFLASEVLGASEIPRGGDVIGLRDCEFAWSRNKDEEFRLSVRGEVVFVKGKVNLVTGPTGAGKTALVMALLGEMHYTPLSPNAYINLPREGGVAYAAQEPWLLHDTIRGNILFGQPYDEERYNKVLGQCALVKDLQYFDAGDGTEVGEMGVTLSGGQKARIALARAIYSSAEMLLLDDIFAALDAHTAKWIVERCILGDLVRGRTVLLVTHHVALIRPIAHFAVNIGLGGSVSSEAITSANHLPSNIPTVEEIIDPETPPEPQPKSQSDFGKLIMAEEVAKGRIGWKATKLFLSALGGSYPIVFFVILILGFVSTDATNMYQTWYLGYWGSQYERGPVNAVYYLSVYSLIAASTVVFRAMRLLHYAVGNVRSSMVIHRMLVSSILRSTLRWLDETPTSRIIARCTHDLGAIDEPLALAFAEVIEAVVAAAIRLGSVVIITPVFFVPGIVVAVVGSFAARIYLKAQLPVKREASNAKAPILAHFGATVAGLVSVRAYNVQHEFKQELLSRIDNYSRVATLSWDLNRWICARMDFLSAAFSSSLAMYLVYTRSANAANTGFSLNIALEFCTMILLCVRVFNDFEVQSNSLERIQRYTEIEQEKMATEDGRPRASWPSSGDLHVERLSARYSASGPEVLHGISFHIRSGERVGVGKPEKDVLHALSLNVLVVGRTGSGKSTLTLALLRCILTQGCVYYDGLATDKINLDALRSSITIIPQMPELLSGSLRRNLDPFDEHDDSVLNATLKNAGLFALQEDSDEARITLDTSISSRGSNLSVGQRQIIALARAMVRESKLLVLDEATSAIDYKTDTLIQDALRSKLGSDVTVVTIAHRLQTVMDAGKIMVLDAGKLAEFDTPATLLRKEDGIFKRLVDNSGHGEELRAIAFAKV